MRACQKGAYPAKESKRNGYFFPFSVALLFVATAGDDPLFFLARAERTCKNGFPSGAACIWAIDFYRAAYLFALCAHEAAITSKLAVLLYSQVPAFKVERITKAQKRVEMSYEALNRKAAVDSSNKRGNIQKKKVSLLYF